ncbi:MAG: FadR/GntR family transcriptional regulator [Dermatophilus congolensis]|nr:FadR/GntR family transcriptional regulator [Dermatophilus congolensis]
MVPPQGSNSAAWRPVTKARAYELVVDRIEEQILSGALRVGDRLPAERDLASMLEVSRAAVREAIRTLEAQGVVRAGVGVGPDGGTFVSSMPSEAMTRLLRLHVALTNFTMPDVIEARVMLERHSARLAATQATPEDIAALRAVLDAMADPSTSREDFNDLDTRFHVLIAEAGRNRLIADMTTAIRESMRTPILRSFRATDSWDGLTEGLNHGHEAIFAAIETRDAKAAADAVEQHIRYAYDQLRYRKENPDPQRHDTAS